MAAPGELLAGPVELSAALAPAAPQAAPQEKALEGLPQAEPLAELEELPRALVAGSPVEWLEANRALEEPAAARQLEDRLAWGHQPVEVSLSMLVGPWTVPSSVAVPTSLQQQLAQAPTSRVERVLPISPSFHGGLVGSLDKRATRLARKEARHPPSWALVSSLPQRSLPLAVLMAVPKAGLHAAPQAPSLAPFLAVRSSLPRKAQ